MENMFNNLKEKMNETILKDIEFSEQNKEKVRRTINSSNQKKDFNLKYKINYFVSACVSCLLLFGLGYFTLTKLGLLSEDKNTTIPNDLGKNLDTNQNSKELDSIYTPPTTEEYYGDMTKEEITSKMLNTATHFITASGKFEQQNIYKDGTGSTTVTEYKLSTKKEVGGYVKFTNKSYEKNEIVQNEEIIYNNHQLWYIDNIRDVFREEKYSPKQSQKTVTLEEAKSVKLNELYDEIYADLPPIGTAGLSLYPYTMAIEYLGDINSWDIVNQNEELLGQNTIVLQGKLEEKPRSMLIVDTFRFWVDKDTGILVKYETYDANGNLTSYLHPEKLEVNVPIDSKEFESPDLNGYKREVPKDFTQNYKDPKEKDVEVVEHADYYEDEVAAVLELLRKDIPFLYEFNHQDLELFSASYEKYKKDNHAYLTYSYKKGKNELGSGRRLLYVRAYDKDSIVRSWGDFNTEKGKQLGNFTSNGIDWEIFGIKNTPNYHFIGKKDNYIYEVVSQEVNQQEIKSLLESFELSK